MGIYQCSREGAFSTNKLFYIILCILWIGIWLIFILGSSDIFEQIAVTIVVAILLIFSLASAFGGPDTVYKIGKKELIIKLKNQQVKIPFKKIIAVKQFPAIRYKLYTLFKPAQYKLNNFGLDQLTNVAVRTSVSVPDSPSKSWIYLLDLKKPKEFIKELRPLLPQKKLR